MNKDKWRIEEVFALIDSDHKGWIGVYDLEKLLVSKVESSKSIS
jgi:Ca2+-binding EF-hand superfamily protein